MVIELSGVQFGLKSYVWFQNRTSAQRKFDLKSQVWSQTKIARHKVQLPLYYIHFEIAQVQDLVSSNILLMQYWASLKLNSSIFGGEKRKFSKQWLQNLPHDTLCLSFSCNYIGYFKQAVKKKVPDWRVVQLARALRHLTLISRKQVTLTISRVCVVVVLVAVLSSRFSRSFSSI